MCASFLTRRNNPEPDVHLADCVRVLHCCQDGTGLTETLDQVATLMRKTSTPGRWATRLGELVEDLLALVQGGHYVCGAIGPAERSAAASLVCEGLDGMCKFCVSKCAARAFLWYARCARSRPTITVSRSRMPRRPWHTPRTRRRIALRDKSWQSGHVAA